MRIAINGFGRIGRLTFRQLIGREDIEIIAINDLAASDILAHLLRFDTAQGRFPGEVALGDQSIIVNGQAIRTLSERDPSKLPWRELAVDLVLECTGVFRTREKAGMHLDAGAKDVLLSAPAKGNSIQTIVMGVNDDEWDSREHLFSNASCTTNCLAPLLKVIDQKWGIRMGSMTTVHAYTADQELQDAPHSDFRRARAAAHNLVPTSTGAASAAAIVYPPIADKISAVSIRVPVIAGSIVLLDVVTDQMPGSAQEVNAVFERQAKQELNGILQYCEDPIVSSDIVGNPYSSIFDSLMTEVNQGMIKVASWYDNEAGFSARMADLAMKILHMRQT